MNRVAILRNKYNDHERERERENEQYFVSARGWNLSKTKFKFAWKSCIISKFFISCAEFYVWNISKNANVSRVLCLKYKQKCNCQNLRTDLLTDKANQTHSIILYSYFCFIAYLLKRHQDCFSRSEDPVLFYWIRIRPSLE